MSQGRSDPRRLAVEALVRIDTEGAYANLVVPRLLDRSGLPTRDRGFVTELVYGATRMRRACDWLVDRFVLRDVDPTVRAALRLGAYQLHFLGTPAHAAVSSTVEVVPRKARGFVNAILRRAATAEPEWPSDAVRLSYPDWIAGVLRADLGDEAASAAMAAMNERGEVTERPDGYVQDRASQWVAELVDAAPGQRVADLCAAPGGKATALATSGAWVAAADVRPSRVRLVADNVARYGPLDANRVAVVTADGTRPPFREGTFHRVLLDAPCSGLGALRRRPDARWRIQPEAIARLVALQRNLVDAAVALLAPGGVLVYSVCTLTCAESTMIDEDMARRHPEMEALAPPAAPWAPLGRGALLLPQAAGTDGMAIFRWRAPSRGGLAGL